MAFFNAPMCAMGTFDHIIVQCISASYTACILCLRLKQSLHHFFWRMIYTFSLPSSWKYFKCRVLEFLKINSPQSSEDDRSVKHRAFIIQYTHSIVAVRVVIYVASRCSPHTRRRKKKKVNEAFACSSVFANVWARVSTVYGGRTYTYT